MIKGGPKIINDGLVLCLDAHDAKSYAGEPVTNLASDSFYTWVNSGAWTQNTYTTHESSPVGFPPGLKGVSGVQVLEGICTTAGSIHFGTGHVNPASASTQYTYSVWFYQKGRAGIGGPYARANVSNSNLGTMKYNGTTGSSNWPVNKWIKLEITFTTQGSDTQTYISNYIGSQVGDTMYFCAAQSEQKSYYSPYADSSRSATDGWKDRTTNNNHGTLTNMVGTGAGHYRDGQVIMPVDKSYLDFDASDDRVAIGSIGSMTEFTVELWINPDVVQDYQNPIDCNYSYNGTTGNIGPRLEFRTGANPNWIISGDTGNNNNYYNIVARSGAPSAGTWYHAALTYDGSGNASGLKSYWNGSLVTSGATNVNSPSAVWVNTMNNVQLGLGFHLGSSRHFNGKISTTKIYNRTLAASEVLSNYNATKQRFS